MSASGAAVGGTINISQMPNPGALYGLTVPAGVTALQNWSQQSQQFNPAGNLINAGTYYLYSTNPVFNTGTLNAANIYNSGLLSSVYSTSGAIKSFNMTLKAAQDILNTGTISSSGMLNLIAGRNITSRTLPDAVSPSTLSASNGIRASAPQIDLNSVIQGVLNIQAEQARVIASQGSLTLGSIEVAKDPLLASMANIYLTNQVTAGQALSVIAGQDILAKGAAVKIDTSSVSGAGGDVLMVAGAHYAVTPTGITLLGGTASGGKVDLNINKKNYVATFDTQGATTGGNVNIAAFAGTSPGSGTINMSPSMTMKTGGTTSSGDVALIGGSESAGGSAVSPSGIDTRGGATGGYIVSIPLNHH